MCPGASANTFSILEQLKTQPIDLGHDFVKPVNMTGFSCHNKVMLNLQDNGRLFHLQPDCLYNKENQSIKKNLLYVKFTKCPETVNDIETILSDLIPSNFHVYRDSLTSCIVHFENEEIES